VEPYDGWHGIGRFVRQRISLNNLKEKIAMSMERYIRVIAGLFVLISLALAHWVSPYWLWFTAFVGANLLQSGFTKWCLMEDILKKIRVGGSCGCADKTSAVPPSVK
jgi:hypothetical protein